MRRALVSWGGCLHVLLRLRRSVGREQGRGKVPARRHTENRPGDHRGGGVRMSEGKVGSGCEAARSSENLREIGRTRDSICTMDMVCFTIALTLLYSTGAFRKIAHCISRSTLRVATLNASRSRRRRSARSEVSHLPGKTERGRSTL